MAILRKFQVGGILQTPKDYTINYINSPKYKERLETSGYDVDSEVNARQNNVQSVSTYGQYGNPSERKEIQLKAIGRPFTASGGSSFLPKKNAIVIDHKQAKDLNIHPNIIAVHEFGHAEVGVNSTDYNEETGIRNSRLNINDTNEIGNRLKGTANPIYKKVPDEIKSDLNALRYELLNKGIYDAGTEEFKKSQLNGLDNSYIKNRLLKNYSEDDLEWLMNNIAQTDTHTNINPIVTT